MQHMGHEAWLQQLLAGDSLRSAARKVGVAPSTITRQLERSGRLGAEMVIDLARAYGRSPVDALIETGYVREGETSLVGIAQALAAATNAQLLAEIAERVDPDGVRDFHGGDSNVISPDFSAIRPVVDDDDPLAGIDPQQYAAHPRTESIEEDNPTP